jgi:hypothetical protein
VRITVAHTKSREEIKRVVDKSFDDLFRGIGSMPVQIMNEKRAWNDNVLAFSFDAKVTLLTTPVKGTITVADRDVIIDVDFGLMEKLLPSSQKAAIETRIKGLLT